MNEKPMNKILMITLIAFGLGACNDKSYQKNENSISEAKTENSIQDSFDSTLKPKPLATQPKKSIAEPKLSTQEITCMGTDLNHWYAFDDYIEQSKCEKVEDLQIKNYICSIEDNAFSLGFKAANLTNYNDHRILAFRTLTQCKEALEIREANRETA